MYIQQFYAVTFCRNCSVKSNKALVEGSEKSKIKSRSKKEFLNLQVLGTQDELNFIYSIYLKKKKKHVCNCRLYLMLGMHAISLLLLLLLSVKVDIGYLC